MDQYGWVNRDRNNYDSRSMPPGERLRLGLKVTEAARERMKAEIRAQHPEWTEQEVFKEFICRTLPADLVKKVYGWEGYPSNEPDEREIRRRMYERSDRTVDK